jgi:hypothetical protein
LDELKARRGTTWQTALYGCTDSSAGPKKAALFYVTQLGFAITDEKADLISLHGENLNWFIERGVALGPVLEVNGRKLRRSQGPARAERVCDHQG